MKKKLLFLTVLLLEGLAAPVLASESAPSVASSPVAAATAQTSPGIMSNLWSIGGSVLNSCWNVGSFGLNTVLGCVKGLCKGCEVVTASKWTMIPAGVASLYGAYYWYKRSKYQSTITKAEKYITGTEQRNRVSWPTFGPMAHCLMLNYPTVESINNHAKQQDIINRLSANYMNLDVCSCKNVPRADVRINVALGREIERVQVLIDKLDSLIGNSYGSENRVMNYTNRRKALHNFVYPKRLKVIELIHKLALRKDRLIALHDFVGRHGDTIIDKLFPSHNYGEGKCPSLRYCVNR